MSPPLDPELQAFWDAAWQRLTRACVDHRAPWRTVQIGTVNADGLPEVRSVILRRVDRSTRRLTIHTDTRSEKVTAWRSMPAASLHAWDPKARLQIRIGAQVVMRTGAALTADDWQRLSTGARQPFLQTTAPGSPIIAPDTLSDGPTDAAAPPDTFCVAHLLAGSVDLLELSTAGHRRARFEIARVRSPQEKPTGAMCEHLEDAPAGAITGAWTAP